MGEITSYLFPNYHREYIYPNVFLQTIKNYMNEKDIYLSELEEEISMNIVSYYDMLTRSLRYISKLERTIYELEGFLPMFAEHGHYQRTSHIVSIGCVFRMFEQSLLFHKKWIYLVEKWYNSLYYHITLGEMERSIIIDAITELIYFYDNVKHQLIENPDLKYLKSRIYGLIYRIITASKFNVEMILKDIVNIGYLETESNLFYFLFISSESENIRLRNRIILHYFMEGRRRGISFHQWKHNIRRIVSYAGDFHLYQSMMIIIVGLSRLVKCWNIKRRIRYMNTKLKIMKEIQSLPSNYLDLPSFIGGKDYRDVMIKYKKESIVN